MHLFNPLNRSILIYIINFTRLLVSERFPSLVFSLRNFDFGWKIFQSEAKTWIYIYGDNFSSWAIEDNGMEIKVFVPCFVGLQAAPILNYKNTL